MTLTARFSSLQLALVLVALTALAVVAGVALEHVSAFGSLGSHPVNPRCSSC